MCGRLFAAGDWAGSCSEHLVAHARAQGLGVVRLETGIYQREAIALYERGGFRRIRPFGPYTDDPLSRCYEKAIPADSA
jgi:ribosomal protein S18 acetylase RimI-like enzyme